MMASLCNVGQLPDMMIDNCGVSCDGPGYEDSHLRGGSKVRGGTVAHLYASAGVRTDGWSGGRASSYRHQITGTVGS